MIDPVKISRHLRPGYTPRRLWYFEVDGFGPFDTLHEARTCARSKAGPGQKIELTWRI